MNAIYELIKEASDYGTMSSEQYEKMMHPIPEAESVDRASFLLERATDKRVLDIGCTGELSAAISEVAKEYYGIDKVDNPGIENYYQIDFDAVWNMELSSDKMPRWVVDYVIASEIIEHLSNAGHFLDLLKVYDCPIILTAPNGLSSAGQYYIKRGIEHVNRDHVAWYSWFTLQNLIERHGYKVLEWYWYNGQPGTAEGMIFVFEVNNGTN